MYWPAGSSLMRFQPTSGLAKWMLRLAIISGAIASVAPRAHGLVVSGLDPLPAPTNGYIGNFRGCTGVCIGTDWIISAKHVGGEVGSWFICKDQAYQVVECRPHPTMDLVLYRMDRPLPGFHRLAESAALGDPVILGGFGFTSSGAMPDASGYDWNGPRQETWGANVIDGEGGMFSITFDPPSHARAVPHEGQFALSDSGGGMFVVAADGSLQLAGIAVSVMGWGSSRWGYSGFALNLTLVRNWIQPIVDRERPITSGQEAPRASRDLPAVEPVLNIAECGALIERRRRALVA